jgi:predicted ribosome quality control (RQC) complex YloA/Tae2 family protein
LDELLIGRIVEEVRAALAGRAWGRVFQLSRAALAVEFRPGEGLQLLLSAEPNRPRLHLVRRNARELERASQPPSGFAQLLRKRLGGATFLSV